MRMVLEIDEVTHSGLNSALDDISKVLNRHFVASGNKILLQDEKDDSYDAYNGKTKHTWLIKISLEWIKIKPKN